MPFGVNIGDVVNGVKGAVKGDKPQPVPQTAGASGPVGVVHHSDGSADVTYNNLNIHQSADGKVQYALDKDRNGSFETKGVIAGDNLTFTDKDGKSKTIPNHEIAATVQGLTTAVMVGDTANSALLDQINSGLTAASEKNAPKAGKKR